MSYVLDGERGETTIEAHGVAHHIVFAVDSVRRVPLIKVERSPSPVQIGTRTTIVRSERACSIINGARGHFVPMAVSFVFLNPHLDIRLSADCERSVAYKATDPTWKKWTPSQPTSPHWYDEADPRA
jgi:hypothetical protein